MAINVVAMLFKKCSYILELDTEIFKGEMTMSEICFKIL